MILPETIKAIRKYQSNKVKLRLKIIQRDQYEELMRRCTATKKATSYQYRIDSINEEIRILRRVDRRMRNLMADIRRDIEGNHFNVYYCHVVRGLSIKDTAKACHYSRSGVCKILKNIRKRVDR